MYWISAQTPAFYVSKDSISARFWTQEDNCYDVMLDINSNKFFATITADEKWVEKFELVSMKWFAELSMELINTIKKLIFSLFIMKNQTN